MCESNDVYIVSDDVDNKGNNINDNDNDNRLRL